MKKWIAALTALLILMLASTAMAMSQSDWAKECLYKVSGTTTVYDLFIHDPVATTTDLTDGQEYEFLAIGAVTDAYVKPMDAEVGGKTPVFYLDGGGNVQEGYITSSAISYNGVSMDVGMGKAVSIPAAIADDPVAIISYVKTTYGYQADLDAVNKAISQKSDKTNTSSKGKKKSAAPVQRVDISLVDDDGDEQKVTLKTLGTVYSDVVLDGETLTVSTADLRWDSEAKESQALALINAPRSGEASLRSKASSKGSVLMKCKTNRVVIVLKVGKKFSRVLYDDTVGFVLTSALKFCPVGYVKDEKAEDPTTGWITFRGKTDSNNTINVRMNGKNGSRILGDFKAGTPITIFEVGSKWAEIEVEGYHCFILSEFVTVDEGTEVEDAPDEDVQDEDVPEEDAEDEDIPQEDEEDTEDYTEDEVDYYDEENVEPEE